MSNPANYLRIKAAGNGWVLDVSDDYGLSSTRSERYVFQNAEDLGRAVATLVVHGTIAEPAPPEPAFVPRVPTAEPPAPTPGYRFLDRGEIIHKNDHFFSGPDRGWVTTECPGETAFSKTSYRRRIV